MSELVNDIDLIDPEVLWRVLNGDPPPISEAIKIRRLHLGMKQLDVATRLLVTPGLVSQWETGRTRVPRQLLPRIAEALQTKVNSLVQHSMIIADLSPDTFDASPQSNAISSDELTTEASSMAEENAPDRIEHQEQILLGTFRLMSDYQRELALRLFQAIRG